MALWTAGQDAQLKALYAEGNSCSVIGALIGKSRNAIIGRVHRLKLPRRGAGARTAVEVGSRPKAAPRAKAAPRERPLRVRVLRPPQEQIDLRVAAVEPLHINLIDLESYHCRYPYGDGIEAPFTFCGHQTFGSYSYCAAHFFLTQQPSKPEVRNRHGVVA